MKSSEKLDMITQPRAAWFLAVFNSLGSKVKGLLAGRLGRYGSELSLNWLKDKYDQLTVHSPAIMLSHSYQAKPPLMDMAFNTI